MISHGEGRMELDYSRVINILGWRSSLLRCIKCHRVGLYYGSSAQHSICLLIVFDSAENKRPFLGITACVERKTVDCHLTPVGRSKKESPMRWNRIWNPRRCVHVCRRAGLIVVKFQGRRTLMVKETPPFPKAGDMKTPMGKV